VIVVRCWRRELIHARVVAPAWVRVGTRRQKCMAALAFNGGNILLPKPGFPLYQALAEFHGLEPRFYQLLEDRGWEADLHHLTSLADHNTAAVLVCNPGNPTGQNYTYAQQAPPI
jgi:tyrosine aminotransferase